MTTIDFDSKTLKWRHPTGRNPKHVVIVGLGPTKADLLNGTSGHTPNKDLMAADEVWGVNAAINQFAGRIRYDMIWMMDNLHGEFRKYPQYIEYMKQYLERHRVPLMTSEAGEYADIENIYEYPLYWIYAMYGDDAMYFHNSIPYMVCYALAIGVKRLELWGCDYSYEKHKTREDDRANAEYWIGFARSKGMKVLIPVTSSLTSADKGLYFYGYDDQPSGKVLEALKKSGAKAELVENEQLEQVEIFNLGGIRHGR